MFFLLLAFTCPEAIDLLDLAPYSPSTLYRVPSIQYRSQSDYFCEIFVFSLLIFVGTVLHNEAKEEREWLDRRERAHSGDGIQAVYTPLRARSSLRQALSPLSLILSLILILSALSFLL